MSLIIGIQNFIGIKKLEFNLADIVIFLGHNNSGKTMAMELIYGIQKYILNMDISADGITKNNAQYESCDAWFRSVEKQINSDLSQNKDKIVRSVFKKNINIGRLYVRLENEETYSFSFTDITAPIVTDSKDEKVEALPSWEIMIEQSGRQLVHIYTIRGTTSVRELENIGATLMFRRIIAGESSTSMPIYLPASRTGLQMLHKYYFANRSNETSVGDGVIVESNSDEAEHTDYSLTSPVVDYLDFVYNYERSPQIAEENEKLLSFMETMLLDGTIKKQGKDLYYKRNQRSVDVPMYLSSSMINELAPIYQVISSPRRYGTIYYDEIETCLHPLMQQNMARLIVRLTNSGYRMIVSTHSDNMASMFNLLFLLASKSSSDAEKNGFEADDILKDRTFKIYEFVVGENGVTTVNDIDFNEYPASGAEFSLFNKNVEKLFELTKKVIGD